MAPLFPRATIVAFGLALLWAMPGSAALSPSDESMAALSALDVLVSPNQDAAIQVRLKKTAQRKLPVAGQSLELVQGDKVIGETVTDEGGRALFHYVPKVKGTVTLTVRGKPPSPSIAPTGVRVSVWERRTPLLAVEFGALELEPGSRKPIADAADELTKLSLFYYNILYVVSEVAGQDDAFAASADVRRWLADNRFPPGHILVLAGGVPSFGATLDELRAAGWATLKIGVGRSRGFAEAFLQRRLEAVMVPEPAKGEVPRKAKIAKEWKEVRKQL